MINFFDSKKTIFIVALFLSSLSNAMDEANLFHLSKYSASEQETLKNRSIEISLDNQMVFIGDNDDLREDLKKIFGTDFPLNTIFLKCKWLLPCRKTGLEDGEWIPAYIPYHILKDVKENDTIKLVLGGKEYEVVCKQFRRKNFRSNLSFQELIEKHRKQFEYHANWHLEGQQILIDTQVVNPSIFNHHGINSPFKK